MGTTDFSLKISVGTKTMALPEIPTSEERYHHLLCLPPLPKTLSAPNASASLSTDSLILLYALARKAPEGLHSSAESDEKIVTLMSVEV
ncbi:hypothetical protein EYF80_045428 [Liparis tanakae]|uniref:Uncharacterized protein n=1 Tax=Liparis tanakae TaxID=230148 RepID=A0A4Z2FTN5_9TELE|nr:hypothetical protein EYF80_045428 [Liparis tanakae]